MGLAAQEENLEEAPGSQLQTTQLQPSLLGTQWADGKSIYVALLSNTALKKKKLAQFNFWIKAKDKKLTFTCLPLTMIVKFIFIIYIRDIAFPVASFLNNTSTPKWITLTDNN